MTDHRATHPPRPHDGAVDVDPQRSGREVPASDPQPAAAAGGAEGAGETGTGSLLPPETVDLGDDAALVALADLDAETAAGLEAMLFLADEPVDVLSLAELLDLEPSAVDAACQGLAARHRRDRRGTEVRRAAGGWRMYSSPLARPVLERWARSGRSGRLTQAALETLAVIAYKQPISRADIGEIRGVNADGAVRSLVARGFVAEVARDDGPGQALLYGTTTTFLERLGLDSLEELPALTEFLPDDGAPDEPELGRLGEVRRQLRAGEDLPARRRPDTDEVREAATRRFGDVRARLAAAGAEAAPEPAEDRDDDTLPPPTTSRSRREAETEMDALTDQLERAARSAVDQLRTAQAASEPADDGDQEDDRG